MFQVLKKLYPHLDSHTRHNIPLSSAFGLLVSLSESLGIGLILPFLMLLADPSTLERISWLKEGFASLGFSDVDSILAVLGLSMVSMFIIKNILVVLLVRWQFYYLANGEADMAIRLMKKYYEVDFSFFSKKNTAELIRNIDSEIRTVFTGFLMSMLFMFMEVIVVAGIMVIVFIANYQVALGVGLFFFVFSYIYHFLTKRYLSKLGKVLIATNVQVMKAMRESLGGLKEVKVLNRVDTHIAEFEKTKYEQAIQRAAFSYIGSIPRCYLEVAMMLGLASVTIIVLSGKQTAEILGVLGVFAAAGLRVMPSVNRILSLLQQVRIATPAVLKVIDELELPAFQVDYPEPSSHLKHNSLAIENVSFRYEDVESYSLEDVSLNIPLGSSVGIVGASGAGKSTLADIILGLYNPTKGSIRINGESIFGNLSEWRQRIGYVPQKIFISDDTIRNNIALGVAEQNIDEHQIKLASKNSCLDEFLDTVPGGLDARIGEEGGRLSGGQRQRIAIARALYHDPDILVFDEATSALDNVTEFKLSELINELGTSKTLIIIAHRLSTIKSCDQILFLKDGKVQAIDTFENLHAANKEFAALVEKSGAVTQSV